MTTSVAKSWTVLPPGYHSQALQVTKYHQLVVSLGGEEGFYFLHKCSQPQWTGQNALKDFSLDITLTLWLLETFPSAWYNTLFFIPHNFSGSISFHFYTDLHSCVQKKSLYIFLLFCNSFLNNCLQLVFFLLYLIGIYLLYLICTCLLYLICTYFWNNLGPVKTKKIVE